MKHLLCLGLLATIPALGACTDDEPPVTSGSNSDPGSSSSGDTLASDVTNIESSGSESSTVSVGSSESSGGSSGESGTGSESSSGDSAPESSSEGGSESGSSETAACEVITEDVSAIGMICDSVADCPEDYGCFWLGGFNPQPYCHIACTMDCECPAAHSCMPSIEATAPWTCQPG